MVDTNTLPRMMTIREVAKTGLLPEHALRIMVKQGNCPCVYIGSKVLINFDLLLAKLNSLNGGANG